MTTIQMKLVDVLELDIWWFNQVSTPYLGSTGMCTDLRGVRSGELWLRAPK